MPRHAYCAECGSTELEVLHITRAICKSCGRSKLKTYRKDQSKRWRQAGRVPVKGRWPKK